MSYASPERWICRLVGSGEEVSLPERDGGIEDGAAV